MATVGVTGLRYLLTLVSYQESRHLGWRHTQTRTDTQALYSSQEAQLSPTIPRKRLAVSVGRLKCVTDAA